MTLFGPESLIQSQRSTIEFSNGILGKSYSYLAKREFPSPPRLAGRDVYGHRLNAQSAGRPSVPSPGTPTSAVSTKTSNQEGAPSGVPPAADQPAVEPKPGGEIGGVVLDSGGDVVMGAQVTLVAENPKSQRTVLTNGTGGFNFTGLGSGNVSADRDGQRICRLGVGNKIVLEAGQNYAVPSISLTIATATTTVTAVFSGHDLAEQQMHAEEKQRVLGIVPNFYTTYIWKAEPLTSKQKFRLAWRSSIDPVTFLGAGVVAGIQQAEDDFSEYGQGAEGYAKRYGANYADGLIGVMIGGAILPSILHQDPRYFYKGTGSIRSRALYAMSTVLICKGDNGRWQANYSNVFGTLAASAISNSYYPANDRGVQLTIENTLIGLGTGAGTALLQEFLLRKISRGVPASSGAQP